MLDLGSEVQWFNTHWGNILLLEFFCFQIVKPLIPILALLPITFNYVKPRLMRSKRQFRDKTCRNFSTEHLHMGIRAMITPVKFHFVNFLNYVKFDYIYCHLPLVYFYRPQRSWGKVIFSQASVILLTGGGVPAPGGGCSQGGVWSRGVVWSWGGGLVPGGCIVETPRDGHCCGRYASYWNAF